MLLSFSACLVGSIRKGSKGKHAADESNIEWVVGDAQALPIPSNSMDSYTIAFGLRNVTRISDALQEAHRVSQAS